MDIMERFFKHEGTKKNNQLNDKNAVSYSTSLEVILDIDRHSTSQPTQPPSTVNEQHHSRQQDLAVRLSRTPNTVTVVQNISIPLGQLPDVAVRPLNECKYYTLLCFSLKINWHFPITLLPPSCRI